MADAYERGAKEAGAEVRRHTIDELTFDPTLHQGYDVIQELEPDLIQFQKNIQWADHFVVIYPNWWSTMPAKMKGLFDRAFLPGFAFQFVDDTFVPLLKKKSARIINIVGSVHPLLLYFKMGSYTNELAKGILKSCGIRPVRVCHFGPTRGSSEAKRGRWITKVAKMAKRDAEVWDFR